MEGENWVGNNWARLAAWERILTAMVGGWSLAAAVIYLVTAVDVLTKAPVRLLLPWWVILLTDLALVVWVRFVFRDDPRRLRRFGWYFWITQVWFPVPTVLAALAPAQAYDVTWFELVIGPEAVLTAWLWPPVLRLYGRIRARIDARRAARGKARTK